MRRRRGVPPGVPHQWWNAGDEELHLLVEVRPALRLEEYLQAVFWLARNGRPLGVGGIRNLLQASVLLGGPFADHLYLPSPPVAMQKVVFTLLRPLARVLGYRAHYPGSIGSQEG